MICTITRNDHDDLLYYTLMELKHRKGTNTIRLCIVYDFYWVYNGCAWDLYRHRSCTRFTGDKDRTNDYC